MGHKYVLKRLTFYSAYGISGSMMIPPPQDQLNIGVLIVINNLIFS